MFMSCSYFCTRLALELGCQTGLAPLVGSRPWGFSWARSRHASSGNSCLLSATKTRPQQGSVPWILAEGPIPAHPIPSNSCPLQEPYGPDDTTPWARSSP